MTLRQGWGKRGFPAAPSPGPNMGRNLLSTEEMRMEAASGFEPESRGFADLRLNHLATPPVIPDYRRLGRGDQGAGSARADDGSGG